MATSDLSSVGKSSDIAYDFTCTSCFEDGRNKEAINHCVDCNSYFCRTCVQYHNKILKSHTMLDKAAMKAGQSAVKILGRKSLVGTLPTDTCEEHPGKIVEMFCGQDDIVCCTVCIALYHRTCDGIEYIPNIAKGITSSQKESETCINLQQTKKELKLMKLERENELATLKKKREDLVKSIHCFKERILAKLEEMTMASLKDVHGQYKEIADKIDEDISCLDDKLQSVEKGIKDLLLLKGGSNEAQLFVNIKHGEKVVRESNKVLQQIEKSGEKSIEFDFNDDIESALDRIKIFGKCIAYGSDCRFSASDTKEHNVRVLEDKEICSIFDACIIDDDQIVMTDNSNKKLKRLDATYTVTDACYVPGHPWGVCRVDSSQVAVSLDLEQMIQLVTVGNTMVPERSFKVGAHCKGISFLNDEFYVSCDGDYFEQPQVKIYDISGSPKRAFHTDQTGQNMFDCPQYISLSPTGFYLYISDESRDFLVLNNQGKLLRQSNDSRLKDTMGSCLINSLQVLVCGYRSNNIVLVNKQGEVVHELLSQTDGIEKPTSVLYLQTTNTLIITSEFSDKILVSKVVRA